MKKILKFLLFIIPASLVLLSCEDEDSIRFDPAELGDGPSLRLTFVPEFSFINFGDLTTAKLDFSVFSTGSNIDRVEITHLYFDFSADSTYARTIMTTLTQADIDAASGFIPSIVYTAADLTASLGLTIDSLGGGDIFNIEPIYYTTDGRIFPDSILVGTPFEDINIDKQIVNQPGTAEFTFTSQAFVACPTDQTLWEGSYVINCQDLVDPFGFDGVYTSQNDFNSNLPADITYLGTPEPFRYQTSECCCRLWSFAFGAGSDNIVSPFYNICEIPLMIAPNSGGLGDHTGTDGSRDPVTGEIIMVWFNFNNPIGATTVYTPV